MKKTILTILFALLVAVVVPSVFAEGRQARPSETSVILKAVLVEVGMDVFKQASPDKKALDPYSMTVSKLMSLVDKKKEAEVIAESRLVVVGNTESEARQVDRTNQPIKQTVTGSSVEPYHITKYQWLEQLVYFSVSVNSNQDALVSGKFVFQYEAGCMTNDDNEEEDKKLIGESSFTAKGHLLSKKNIPVLVSVAINSDTAKFLILNADF